MPLGLAIRHVDGRQETLELPPGPLRLGRDNASDVVLDDPRCSRHHAEIRIDPDCLTIHDVGSTNGVHVNGHRVDLSQLVPGDRVRLGRTWLEILASTEDPPWRSGVPSSADLDTPPTLTLLAALWATPTPLTLGFAILAVLTGHLSRNALAGVLAAAVIVLPLSLAMMLGLSTGRHWAYRSQLVLAVPGVLSLVLTPLSLVVAAYLLHPGLRRRFGYQVEAPVVAASHAARQESVFVAALTGGIVFAGALAGILVGMAQRPPDPGIRLTSQERLVVRQLADMSAAQESFRRVCNVGYADLDGLRRPASAIPGYPKAGPVFLSPSKAPDQAHGYRFDLTVQDPLPSTLDCPVTRHFGRFSYTAWPLSGKGRHFLLDTTGVIHTADNRAATLTDPPIATVVR